MIKGNFDKLLKDAQRDVEAVVYQEAFFRGSYLTVSDGISKNGKITTSPDNLNNSDKKTYYLLRNRRVVHKYCRDILQLLNNADISTGNRFTEEGHWKTFFNSTLKRNYTLPWRFTGYNIRFNDAPEDETTESLKSLEGYYQAEAARFEQDLERYLEGAEKYNNLDWDGEVLKRNSI